MNFHARNRVVPESPFFGFTVREIAFMRSMSEPELSEWMGTLREIRALPSTEPWA